MSSFMCDVCGREFESELSQEDAVRSADEFFGVAHDPAQCGVLCPECWPMFVLWWELLPDATRANFTDGIRARSGGSPGVG